MVDVSAAAPKQYSAATQWRWVLRRTAVDARLSCGLFRSQGMYDSALLASSLGSQPVMAHG